MNDSIKKLRARRKAIKFSNQNSVMKKLTTNHFCRTQMNGVVGHNLP